ncbi:MAG TPA: dihydrofolate reductase family protein [Solirubrobacteraceae bacterium]|nr:dihydrofolate reductase family protein [Solirubrobacteraceae bacterium]
MGRVIVIEFVTLDGVMHDPDGREGFEHGGWAFRFGPEAVAGDKFKLGELFDTGTLLLGRATWERFAQIWPGRDDEFSTNMNRIPKLVVSRSRPRVEAWSNSSILEGELEDEVARRKQSGELVITGSASIVRALSERDLIDEIRLLVFPIVLGAGRRLFDQLAGPAVLELVGVERSGAAARLTYVRARS